MKNVFLFTIIAIACLCMAFKNTNKQTGKPVFKEPDMVFVAGGSFLMGNNRGEKNEMPEHAVKLSDFYIGKYEVTQSLWQSIMGNNPAASTQCDDCPVEEVSPAQVDDFISKLNKLTGKKYRLPTEAEWEYAARGGNKSAGYKYSGASNLADVGWFKDNADNKTHPVGQKKPNELGIYDMSGNVWELCADWFDKSFYKSSLTDNPVNNKTEKYRVVRGGSWRSPVERCFNTARNRNIADHHRQNGGFRLALNN